MNGAIPAQVAMASAIALLSSPTAMGVKGQRCVCGGGGGERGCQLVRLVGTLMPDCVGSVANGLGYLKVLCCICHLVLVPGFIYFLF